MRVRVLVRLLFGSIWFNGAAERVCCHIVAVVGRFFLFGLIFMCAACAFMLSFSLTLCRSPMLWCAQQNGFFRFFVFFLLETKWAINYPSGAGRIDFTSPQFCSLSLSVALCVSM